MTSKPRNLVTALLLANFSLILLLVGATFNFQVMVTHEGKMPVYYDYIYKTDEQHFVYDKWKGVEYWYLSDIFEVNERIYSIGDLIMFFSIAVYMGLMTYVAITLKRQRRKKRV